MGNLIPVTHCMAQQTGPKHSIALMTGFGTQRWLVVPYTYNVTLFQCLYTYRVWKKSSWSLEVLTAPQVNLTKYRKVDNVPDQSNGYELGINAGMFFRKIILDKSMDVWAGVSIGPHYISGAPERQSSGFIFSDNVFGGLRVSITRRAWLNSGIGFRHISNASLKQPNDGVNNIIVNIGFGLSLD